MCPSYDEGRCTPGNGCVWIGDDGNGGGGGSCAVAKFCPSQTTPTYCCASNEDCSNGHCCRSGTAWTGSTCGNPCNNDAVCDPDEENATCADCGLCNDARRNNEDSCQGGPDPAFTSEAANSNFNSESQCRWCHDTSDAYEYDIPLTTGQTSWPFCVNITNDPFNCGKCGFNDQGIQDIPADQAHGVCAGNQPYCADKECRKPGESIIAEYFTAYKASHPTLLNPSYVYPYAHGRDVFAPDEIDSSDAACRSGGGTLNPEFGCCGDGKCRVTEGKICHATRICDGIKWHDASLTSQNGEVFLTPECRTIYPIANINGDFIQCVDEDQFQNYLMWMARAAGACIPDEYAAVINNFPQWHTEGNRIPWEWGIQYVCPAGHYLVGDDATSTGSSGVDQCRIKPINPKVSSSGFLVCSAWIGGDNADLFGFATMGNAGYTGGTSIAGWFTNPAGGEHNIPLCPAPISQWDGVSTTVPILACPGKIPVSVPAGRITLMVYGSNAGKRFAIFCSDNPALKIDSTLDFMGYVKGNVSYMGTVINHDYMCYTDSTINPSPDYSRARIAICCGADKGCSNIPGTLSSSAGARLYYYGDKLLQNDIYLYCLTNGSWSKDLDYNSTQDACERAGFFNTSRYCCSESHDNITWLKESYNDIGGPGGCFKSTRQDNTFYLKYPQNSTGKEYRNVLVYNGSFQGCGFNTSYFAPEFTTGNPGPCNLRASLTQQCLESIEDWPNPGINFKSTSTWRTQKPLINRTDYCTMFNTTLGNYYCSYANNWTLTQDNLSHKSVVPKDLFDYINKSMIAAGRSTSGLRNASCCRLSECWDPNVSACIFEQTGWNEFIVVNDTVTYKCLGGNWTLVSAAKKTPDGCYLGVCPNSNQCLLNVSGIAADNGNLSGNPQCINSSQYLGDYLCVNGSWTTRTKMLALKLTSLVGAGDNFVLVCGPAKNVLVKEYNVGASNNWCALNLNGQRIIGTTLNGAFASPNSNLSFIYDALYQAFNFTSYRDMGASFVTSCTEQTKDFDMCVDIDASGQELLKLYYDDDYKTVIMSNTAVSRLKTIINCSALPGWLKWLCPQQPLEKNMAQLQLFNKVYAARQGNNREIFGVAEEFCEPATMGKKWMYTFNLTGFTSADLSYLILNLAADNASISYNNQDIDENIYIKNPKRDPWLALTIMRNPEQE